MVRYAVGLLAGVAVALLSLSTDAAEVVSAAKAKANNAYRFANAKACRARCAELSGESQSSANCTNNCKPGVCYYNSGTGNYYCVP